MTTWSPAQFAAWLAQQPPAIQARYAKEAKALKVPRQPKVVGALPSSIFDGETLRLILPLPDRRLHPNGCTSLHWTAKGRLVKAQRESAYGACLEATAKKRDNLPWPGADLSIVVYLSAKRNADQDGIVGWLKSTIDGAAQDAGLVVNDSSVTIAGVTILSDRCLPRIELTFRRRE